MDAGNGKAGQVLKGEKRTKRTKLALHIYRRRQRVGDYSTIPWALVKVLKNHSAIW